MYKVK